MNALHTAEKLTMALIAVFMVLAVAIPTVALLSPRPARFGWQMYSVAYPAPRAWLQASDGSTREFDLADRMAALRADTADPVSVGRWLCDNEQATAALLELQPTRLVRVPCD